MDDHQQLPVNGQGNSRRDEAEGQMLQVLEDFFLLAEPDTVHKLDEHLASIGISLRADQLIRELGRLVAKAEGVHDD